MDRVFLLREQQRSSEDVREASNRYNDDYVAAARPHSLAISRLARAEDKYLNVLRITKHMTEGETNWNSFRKTMMWQGEMQLAVQKMQQDAIRDRILLASHCMPLALRLQSTYN